MKIRKTPIETLFKKNPNLIKLTRILDNKTNCYFYGLTLNNPLQQADIKVKTNLKFMEFDKGLFLKDKDKMTLEKTSDVLNSFLLTEIDKYLFFNVKENSRNVLVFFNNCNKDFIIKLLKYMKKSYYRKSCVQTKLYNTVSQ